MRRGAPLNIDVRGLRRSREDVSVSKPAILVVEDEFLLREAAVALVEDAGFEALAAASADEALAILETRAEEVRLVFTDIQIAGSMDGIDLAHAVRNRWPPVELILTSGRRHIQPDDLPHRGRFLPSPTTSTRCCRLSKKWRAASRAPGVNDQAGYQGPATEPAKSPGKSGENNRPANRGPRS